MVRVASFWSVRMVGKKTWNKKHQDKNVLYLLVVLHSRFASYYLFHYGFHPRTQKLFQTV